MKKINKKILTIFYFALGLSIALPAGILGIIFGAINALYILLVLGIVLTCAGFYVMPILWVMYGERRQYRSVLYMIENEHLLTVGELCTQTGYEPDKVRKIINYLIMSRCLVGYLYNNDTLTKNNIKKLKSNKCTNCGAMMEYIDGEYVCHFCGHNVNKVK